MTTTPHPAQDDGKGSTFTVGQRVRALCDMLSDMRDDGMGIQMCARQGDELVIRNMRPGSRFIGVSHEHITDRSFSVEAHEIEPVAAASGQMKGTQ